jgi:hypothetical protein
MTPVHTYDTPISDDGSEDRRRAMCFRLKT